MIYQFRTARVEVKDDIITSTFNDGKQNQMYINVHADDPAYHAIARDHGYRGDWRRYCIEHDLTHHFVADRLGWKWSWALHDPDDSWPDHIAWEEHIVNHLQARVNVGRVDHFGVLQCVFGSTLDQVCDELCHKWVG